MVKELPKPADAKKSAGEDGAPGASPSPAAKKPEAAEEGLEVPPLSNLLEFVAWMVLQLSAEQFEEEDAKERLLHWMHAQGGFLSDEMGALRQASLKLQVLAIPTSPVHSFRPIISLFSSQMHTQI